MPGQWTSIETNFPTFTGKEPVEERLTALYNYMYILTEQLKYNLSNLSSDNFNATALNQLTANASTEAAKAVAEELEKIARQYAQLHARVESLSGRLSAVENAGVEMEARVALLEGTLSEDGQLEQRLRSLEEDLPRLEQAVTGEGGLDEQTQALTDAVSDLQAKDDELEQRLTGEGGANLEGAKRK